MKTIHRKNFNFSEREIDNIGRMLYDHCTGKATLLWEGYGVATLCKTVYFTGISFAEIDENIVTEMSVRYDRFIGRIVIKYLEQQK